MVLIICTPQDEPAIWFYQALKQQFDNVEIVTTQELVYARTITHYVNSTGDKIEIKLFDGRVISSENLSCIVNRLHSLPTEHIQRVTARDRLYAIEEMNAFWLSLLNGFTCPVVNPPTPKDLAGSFVDNMVVAHMATIAKIPIAPFHLDKNSETSEAADLHLKNYSILVYYDNFYGPPLSQSLQESCLLFYTHLGIPLLQIDFSILEGASPKLMGAHGSVDFRIGGQHFIRDFLQSFVQQEITV